MKRGLSSKKILLKHHGAAKFYGMPKIHKATEANLNLRPILSSVDTLTRGLAGCLVKQLNPLVGKFSSSHIKINVDFKKKLRIYSLDDNTGDFKMLSLDVQSLFTQVPFNDVLYFLERKANAGLFTPPIPFNHFRRLIEICVNNCFLEWDGDIYRQTFGVAMGSPFSPVLANLYMEYLETENLPNVAEMPPLWLRYSHAMKSGHFDT